MDDHTEKPLKAILLDIGGVCVLSPFEAIAEYEIDNGIPPNWINYAISRSAPNGSWQRLERGEIKLDDEFFTTFQADLQIEDRWREYHSSLINAKRKLKGRAIPTQDEDEGVSSQNESQEKGASHQPSEDSAANHVPSPSGAKIPSIPPIDAEILFRSMISRSSSPDPYIFPALLRLSTMKDRFILGALTNTVIVPPTPPYDTFVTAQKIIRPLFQIFVASAEVGLRKPERGIYELALRRLDAFDKGRGGDGVQAGEVLFLDDIGENLRTALEVGIRTLRVRLGQTRRAVEQLEELLGVELVDRSVSLGPKL